LWSLREGDIRGLSSTQDAVLPHVLVVGTTCLLVVSHVGGCQQLNITNPRLGRDFGKAEPHRDPEIHVSQASRCFVLRNCHEVRLLVLSCHSADGTAISSFWTLSKNAEALLPTYVLARHHTAVYLWRQQASRCPKSWCIILARWVLYLYAKDFRLGCCGDNMTALAVS
jgi:hypothetical protein